MIEARLRAESLQDAVIAVERAGLPGPVFCDVCPANCGAAHVYFLNDDVSDEEMFSLLRTAHAEGMKLIGAHQHLAPDNGKVFVTLDSSLIYMDEVN